VEVVFGFTSQNYGSVGTLLSTKNAGVKSNQITQPKLISASIFFESNGTAANRNIIWHQF